MAKKPPKPPTLKKLPTAKFKAVKKVTYKAPKLIKPKTSKAPALKSLKAITPGKDHVPAIGRKYPTPKFPKEKF